MASLRSLLVSLSRALGLKRRSRPAEMIRFRPFALR